MKKLNIYIKSISFILLFIVFALQGIWLYETFYLTKSNLKKEITEQLTNATREEVSMREIETEAFITNLKKTSSDTSYIFKMPENNLWNSKNYPVNIMSLELQYHLKLYPRVKSIDSILQKHGGIKGSFVVNRISTKDNSIIESSNPETSNLWDSALRSESIPLRIDESEKVELLLLKPNWSIFYKMSFIIILSFLIVFLVAIGLWWHYKIYKKERLLRQFQKDHTEAVIHNIATPLQTIDVINQTLQNNSITELQQKKLFLEAQHRQITKIQHQVDRMLTISQAEKSRIQLNKKDVALENLITNICSNFNNTKNKEVEFKTSYTICKPTVKVDETLFSDVLNNLIENSIKYSNKNVTIFIDCKLTPSNLTISVTDNGFGIERKYQKHIFEKFNRGAVPFLKGARKGFGIGLSYVKDIIEAHNGTIEVFSEGKDTGTTFTISIPQ